MSPAQVDDEPDGERRPVRTIADASYGTPPESRWRRYLIYVQRWIVLDADRWLVTAMLSLGTFLTIVVFGTFGPETTQEFLTAGIAPGSVLVELLKVIVSVVVIVLSINQLVLSPGLGSAGDHYDRFQETMAIRERIEEHTGVRTSPTSPAHSLQVILRAIADRAAVLESEDDSQGAPDVRSEISDYAATVRREARSVEELLDDGHFGGFHGISPSLRFEISEKLHDLRDIRNEYGEALSPARASAIDDLDGLIELFTVTREYLKTVYIRSEYIELSRRLLYLGLPAAVLTYSAAQLYSPEIFPGTLLLFDRQLLFVAGAVTVGLSPFVLLIAYVLRLAAMSRSTLFVGPFAARSSEEIRRDGS